MNKIELNSFFETDLSQWALSSTTGKKDEAIERIKKAFEENATSLDLSCLDLSSIPFCIGKLHNLEVLFLNINKLEFLPEELGNLSKLQFIALDYNKRLKDLPENLSKIPTLQAITTGGTEISNQTLKNILDQTRSFAAQDKLLKEKSSFQRQDLIFSTRPLKVQEQIDRVYATLRDRGMSWGYSGTIGLYNLLNFDDCDVIAQRIQKASPNKKDLYFIDLGAGHFSWVNSVASFLRHKYSDDKRHFHVIGVTGEGQPFDNKKVDGNVTTHKITGFKLENLLESFAQFDLQLIDSVEFIVTSWTLCHLVDPLGTLEQAYHLLSRGNGFLFGTGFEGHCSHVKEEYSFSATLSLAFGIHSYIARKRDSRPDDFALFRSVEDKYSRAKNKFAYNEAKPIENLNGMDNCFAQCRADLKQKCYEPHVDAGFGGGFHGFGTYVLEQLLGEDEKLLKYEGKRFKMPLFRHGLHFLKLYLDAYEYKTSASENKNDPFGHF